MPEAAKDLPDPLEETPSSSSSSPDDLLSQMADEAIDKLIADADNGITSPSSTSQRAVSAEELAALADETLPAAGSVSSKLEEAEPATESMQGELDSLFNQLDDAPAVVPAGASSVELLSPTGDDPAERASLMDPIAAEPQALDRIDLPSTTMPPPVDVPEDIANDDGHGGSTAGHRAENDAPQEDVHSHEAEASMRADVKALLDDAVEQGRPDAPGLLVRPLQWLNAPFAGVSDEARDTIGQIAIVTLVNAMAVILYVILFRR